MRKLSVFMLGAFMIGSLMSCDLEGPDEEDVVKYEATINSSNTQPKATSSAQGSAVLEYNKVTKVLTYNVTYQGLTPTAAHIHKAQPAWSSGPVVVPFTNVASSPISGSVTLSQDLENLLRFGNLYINIHTKEYPQGEIRGQILLTEF